MNNSELLEHEGYKGTIESDLENDCLTGKILFIHDLVTYTAENIKDLRKAFIEAVEDYLETCAQLGKAPEKTLSGTFNVRVGPERHKKASLAALREGCSMNEFVNRALDARLDKTGTVNHFHLHPVRSETVEFSLGRTPPYEFSTNKDSFRH